MLDHLPNADLQISPLAIESGMSEPGIFKGCSAARGPLPTLTKNAILAYLGKPNAGSWERLAQREIVGNTTLADAWSQAAPDGCRRFPTAAELIRAIRMAVMRQLTRVNQRGVVAH